MQFSISQPLQFVLYVLVVLNYRNHHLAVVNTDILYVRLVARIGSVKSRSILLYYLQFQVHWPIQNEELWHCKIIIESHAWSLD